MRKIYPNLCTILFSFFFFYCSSLSAQTTWYVDDAGNNANPGSAGFPFASINHAISIAQPGDTIAVDAGIYSERIFVTKSLYFKGAYSGVNPGSLLSRGVSETILLPSTENNLLEIITVQAANVNFDGFLFDGDNPAITGSIILNGVDVNAGMGIFNGNLQTDNLVIKNNIFKNFYRYGMLIQCTATTGVIGTLITANHIDNISSKTGRDGRGVGFFGNTYGAITNNLMTRVNSGPFIANTNAGSADSLVISSNSIEAYSAGINAGNLNNLSSPITISSNQISVADLNSWNAPGSSTVNFCIGINLSGINNSSKISVLNNSVSLVYRGIFLGSVSSISEVVLTNNTVTGSQTGIWLDGIITPLAVKISGGNISSSSSVGLFLIGRGSGQGKIVMNNLSLINNVVGIDASAADANALPLEFSGVTINGGTTGIRFYGSTLSLPANSLTGVSFLNQTKEYILQTVNSFIGQTIDASTVSFDGVTPPNMTLAQLFATEDKLTHKIDFNDVGYFKLKPNKVYVTPNSFAATLPPVFGTPTTTPDINRAVGAAAAADTIYIAAGTYTNQITLDKGLTLIGEGQNTTSIIVPATTVAPPGPFTEIGVIQTAQNIGDVNVRDLSVDANGTVQCIIIQSGGSVRNCKLLNGGQGIFFRVESAIKTAVVENNYIQPNGIGINCQGSGLTASILNNTITNPNGFYAGFFGGLDFGPVAQLNISNNLISNYFGVGMLVNSNTGNYNNNSIVGTNGFAIQRYYGNTPNASCNWYGTADAEAILTKMSGTINYAPWLINGTDNDVVASGFQPTPGSCTGHNRFYVNDNSQTGDVFTTAVGNNANNGSSSAPFATINYALSQVQPGDSIYVDAGLYAEDVVISKAIVIRGAQVGNNPGTSLSRGTESIIVPATDDPVNGTIFNILVSDVIVDGFTIDGDNPSISGSVTLNGADINKGHGIASFIDNSIAHNNLIIKNNIIRNIYRYGVFIQSTTTLPLSGNLIIQNRFDNISAVTGRQGRAVGLANNAYATVSQNVFTKVHTAILVNGGFNAASQTACSITGNIIESYRGGIFFGGFSGSASHYLINNNNVTTADLASWNVPGASTENINSGILINNATSAAGMNISNNTITNTYEGLALGRLSASPNWVVNGNTISGSTEIGLYYFSSSATNPSLLLENNTLVDNDTGIYIHYLGAGGAIPVTFLNNSVTGGIVGLQLDGSQVSLPGNILTGLSFTGLSGNYIQLTRNALNGQTIDASSVSFENKTSAQMSLSELFAVENKIAHKIDYDGIGFIKIKPSKVFLTANSFNTTLPVGWGTATTSAELQRAVAAATTNDTIHVEAGTYTTADFTLNKSITIAGPNETINPNDPVNPLITNARNAEAVISNTSITLGANGINFTGLTFDAGNKVPIVLPNSGGTTNNFGNFIFAKNIVKISNTTAALNQIAITGQFVSSPNMPITSGFTFTDNRFEKSGTATGNTFNFNYVKNINVTGNSFLVTGTTLKTQQATNLGSTGLVELFNFSHNTVSEASTAVGGNRIASAAVSNNKIYNTSNTYSSTNTMAEGTNVEISNNEIANSTGTPFMLYTRNATSVAGTTNILKVENNMISGVGVPLALPPSQQLYAAMNFTVFNSILNPSITIRGNKISYTGNFSTAPSEFFRPVTVRGNIVSTTIENNEITVSNSGSMVPVGAGVFAPANPAITIGVENGAAAFMTSASTINILNNKINGFKQSVVFYDGVPGGHDAYAGYGNIPAGATVNINNNSFTGDSISINNGTISQSVNATCNWYGSAGAQNVITKVTSSTVNYAPWLTNGTDNDLAIGFQPVAGSCDGTPVTVTLSSATDVTCFGANNGIINITISGGTEPYTIAWNKDGDPFSNIEDLTNLEPGTYEVLITDANGSVTSLSDIVISEPLLLTASAVGTNVNCFGGSNGSAIVTAEGGTAPYTYLWSNGATTDEITGLIAGNYSVTITDANGCTANANYEVTEPILLTAVATGTSTACFNSIAVVGSGGTAPYTYLWSNGATTSTISSIAPGTYSVIIIDANGCTANASATVTANEAFNPSASVVDVSCYGGLTGKITVTNVNAVAPFAYSIDGGLHYRSIATFDSLAAGTYTITVRDANGCTGFVTKTISQPTQLTAALLNVQSTCFGLSTGAINVNTAGGTAGYTYSWTGPNGYTSSQKNISGLTTGTYIFTITDSRGCTASLSNITVTTSNQILANATVANIACKGELNGSIVVNPTGGSGSGFTYLWNNGSTTNSRSNLGVGNYSVTITDIVTGCSISSNFTITQPASLVNLSTTKTNATGCASLGTITAIGSGGTGSYQYKLDNGLYQTSGSFTGLYAGNYTIWVKDVNGCTKSAVVSITDNGGDEWEGNNSKNQAKAITSGANIFGRIAIAGDAADWYKFTTTSAGSYTLTFTHPSASFVFNMYATGNNTPALVPTASNATSKQYNLAANTTYYISITGGLSYVCYSLNVGPTLITRNSYQQQPEKETIANLFDVRVLGNPSENHFNIQVNSSSNERMKMRVVDVNGRIIEQKENVSPAQVITLGGKYHAGVYFAEIRQGNNFKTIRLIKL